MNLGFDLGFGDTKIAYIHNGELVQAKFPTAVAYSKKGVGALDGFTSVKEYDYEGTKYLVGRKAIYDAFATRSFEFFQKYVALFAYVAVKDVEQTTGVKVTNIAAGLPLAYFNKKNKELIINRLSNITVNGDNIELQVDVVPQGVGVLFDYRVDFAGNEIDGTDIDMLVLDIGFNTVDVLPVEEGIAIKNDSGMLEKWGISRITSELADEIQSEHGLQLGEQEAKKILLDGKCMVYNNEVDLKEVIASITQTYVDSLIMQIQSKWEQRIQRSEKLYVAGGGAYYLKPYIPKKYENLIYIPEGESDCPEYANARGFLKALMSK